LVGWLFAAGQDGPGRALAHAFGGLASLVIWVISVVVILVNARKVFRHLGKGARIAVGLSIVFLPAAIFVSFATYQDYDLRVRNESDDPVDNVVVRMSGKRYSFGAMNSGVTATIGSQRERPTGRAEIRWTGADGQSHRVESDVSELVPRRYNRGLLTFTIYPEENVKVDFFIRPQEAFF
jgi:hypothetical protein